MFPLGVLLHSKAVPIRRMDILPEIPRPNPWDMRSIVAMRSNVACTPILQTISNGPIHLAPNFHPFGLRWYTVSPGANGRHV